MMSDPEHFIIAIAVTICGIAVTALVWIAIYVIWSFR